MKAADLSAARTPDLLGQKTRGRPKLANAKSPAQRQAEYLARKAEALRQEAVALAELSDHALAQRAGRGSEIAWRVLGLRKGWRTQ